MLFYLTFKRTTSFLIAFLIVFQSNSFANKLSFSQYSTTLSRSNIDPFTVQFEFKNLSTDTIYPKIQPLNREITARIKPQKVSPKEIGKVFIDICYQGVNGKKPFVTLINTGMETDTLTVNCMFTPPFIVEPSEFTLPQLFHGDSVPVTFMLSWNELAPSLIHIDPRSITECLSSITIDSLKNGYALTTQLISSGGTDSILDTIILNTNYPPWPFIYIPITSINQPFLKPVPDTIQFGRISQKNRNWKKVSLISKRKKYQIDRAIVTIPFAIASVGRHPDKNWEVAVTIYPNSPPGSFNGEVQLFLPNTQLPELIIPVSGELY